MGNGQPKVTDLGTGNCPTFSPADDRIAFLSNADGVETGVWLMNADGSERRLLGDYGKPMWSPDGRQLMIMSYAIPPQVTLMDANSDKSGVLRLPDRQIYSHPSWAGEGTIVAVIGTTEGDAVALIDVSDPPQAKVKEVLWRKENGPRVEPSYPIYSATTRRCIFVGNEAKGKALYSVQPSKPGPAKRLGAEGYDTLISKPHLFARRPVHPLLRPRPSAGARGTRARESRPCQSGLGRDRPRESCASGQAVSGTPLRQGGIAGASLMGRFWHDGRFPCHSDSLAPETIRGRRFGVYGLMVLIAGSGFIICIWK